MIRSGMRREFEIALEADAEGGEGKCGYLPPGDFCIHLLYPVPDLDDEVFIIPCLALQVNPTKPQVLLSTLPPEQAL